MIDNIWFRCVRLLPLTLDDCVTDYEVLCKVTSAVNEVITETNKLEEISKQMGVEIQTLRSEFVALKNYVDNLDFQNEVDNSLNKMKEDGTLKDLLTDYTTYTFTDFVPEYTTALKDGLRLVNKTLIDGIKAKPSFTICFVGDSITEGTDVYPNLLWVNKMVTKLYSLGKTVSFFNYGLASKNLGDLANPNFVANQSAGDTDTTFWRSWATEGKSWLDCVKATNADLYILMFGYNDVLYNVGLSTGVYFVNMDYVNKQLTNKTVWLTTPIGTDKISPEVYDQRTRLRNGIASVVTSYYCNSIDIGRMFNIALLGVDPNANRMTIYQNEGATGADTFNFDCGISFKEYPINKGDCYILARSLTMQEPNTDVLYTSCVWFDFYTNDNGEHVCELSFQQQGVKGAPVFSQTVAGNNVSISASGINISINGVNYQSRGECCWKGQFIPSNVLLSKVSLLNLFAFTDIILPSHVSPEAMYGVFPQVALYQGNGYSHPSPYGQEVIYDAILELIRYMV